MPRTTTQLAILLLAFLFTSCSGLGNKVSAVAFPAHPKSWHTRGEQVELMLAYDSPNAVNPGRTTEDRVSSQSVGAAAAAGLAIDQTVAFLKKEAKRYEASYSGIAVGDRFYNGWGSDAKINLSSLELKRTVNETQALNLQFDVEPTLDGTAFRIVPAKLKLNLAKAKLHLFNWLEPWTWFGWGAADNDVDLVVVTEIYAAWVDAKGGWNWDSIGKGEFKLRNVKFGKEYSGMNLPKGTFESQLFPAIPRSFLGDDASGAPILGTGNFLISVLVTEVDDYGTTIQEQADRLANEKGRLVEQLVSIFN